MSADMNDNVDAMFEELLGSPISESATNDELEDVIKKARAAETKAKVQIYTMRGKKSLQAAMEYEQEAMAAEQAAAEQGSSVCDELRKMIAQIKAEEEQIQREIADLRRAKEERLQRESARSAPAAAPQVVQQPSYTAPQVVQQPSFTAPQVVEPTYAAPQVVQQPSFVAPQVVQQPSYTAPQVVQQPSFTAPQVAQPSFTAPQVAHSSFTQQPVATREAAPAPVATPAPAVAAPVPAAAAPTAVNTSSVDNVSSSFIVNSTAAQTPAAAASPAPAAASPASKSSKKSKKSKGAGFAGPSSVATQVLSATWDAGSSGKSKKNNKVYTIQVTMNGITWKIVRGDDTVAEFGKKMKSIKADLQPFPSAAKKALKQDQQGELANALTTYLNSINLDTVFKRDKNKVPYLKFFAPFSAKDEGLGSFPGSHNDIEPWFLWKLGLE